jgi:hypothetical protein
MIANLRVAHILHNLPIHKPRASMTRQGSELLGELRLHAHITNALIEGR